MVFNIVIATVLMISFGIARGISKRVYAPRTYLVPERYTYKHTRSAHSHWKAMI